MVGWKAPAPKNPNRKHSNIPVKGFNSKMNFKFGGKIDEG